MGGIPRSPVQNQQHQQQAKKRPAESPGEVANKNPRVDLIEDSTTVSQYTSAEGNKTGEIMTTTTTDSLLQQLIANQERDRKEAAHDRQEAATNYNQLQS